MSKRNRWRVVVASAMAVSNGTINTFGFGGVFLKPVAAWQRAAPHFVNGRHSRTGSKEGVRS